MQDYLPLVTSPMLSWAVISWPRVWPSLFILIADLLDFVVVVHLPPSLRIFSHEWWVLEALVLKWCKDLLAIFINKRAISWLPAVCKSAADSVATVLKMETWMLLMTYTDFLWRLAMHPFEKMLAEREQKNNNSFLRVCPSWCVAMFFLYAGAILIYFNINRPGDWNLSIIHNFPISMPGMGPVLFIYELSSTEIRNECQFLN